MNVIVFDLGGTLMQYVGMPHLWVDYYDQGFSAIIREYDCNVSKDDVEKSIQILKDFNPRVHYREAEYSAEYIFTKALEHWKLEVPITKCIKTFWNGLKLTAEIYPNTIEVLQILKAKGYSIATLTDLPSSMPDEVFKKDITGLLDYFDFYVSSAIEGYRKPHTKGLQMIAERFAVPVTELILSAMKRKTDRQQKVQSADLCTYSARKIG